MLASIISIATHLNAQLLEPVYRPDIEWYTGDRIANRPNEALTNWSWRDNKLRIDRLDLQSSFSFFGSNASYVGENYSLQANGCFLVRNLRDSITSMLQYDSIDLLRPELCTNGSGAIGYEFFLPLVGGKIVYAGEVYTFVEDRRLWLYKIGGHSFTYLDQNILSTSDSTDLAGSVQQQFEVPFGDTLSDECLHYISNPNGGWWGIAKSVTSNKFQRWLVDSDTVTVLPPIRTGPPGFRRERSTTRIAFRPTGDFFAISGTDDGIALYTFDRQTADIQLFDEIPPSFDTAFQFYREASDCAFSACGRYLYVTMLRNVHQFDTYATDIAASGVVINDVDRLPFVTGYKEIERGPDCRMYISWPSSSTVISVIDKPSLPGRACDLYEQGITGLSNYYEFIPHFPDYSLWSKDQLILGLPTQIDTAVCDSTMRAYNYMTYASSTAEEIDEKSRERLLWPNPTYQGQEVFIGLINKESGSILLQGEIYDQKGAMIRTIIFEPGGDVLRFKVPNLSSGIYRVVLRNRRSLEVQGSASLIVR